MLSALKRYVIPVLTEQGFTGKHPNYRQVCDGYIELICFQTNKYGNLFTVEISVAFPDCKDKNYHLYGDIAEEILRVDAINKRYRLPGTFYGWFYYSDVYRKSTLLFRNIYHNVGREEAESFVLRVAGSLYKNSMEKPPVIFV